MAERYQPDFQRHAGKGHHREGPRGSKRTRRRAGFNAKLTNAVVPGFIARGMLQDARLTFTSAGGATLEFILYEQDRIEATYYNPNNRDRGTWSLTRVSSPVVEKAAAAPVPSSAPTGAVASSAAGSNLSPGRCEGKWVHPSFGKGKVYLTVKTVKGVDVAGILYAEGSAPYHNRDLPLTGKISVEGGTENSPSLLVRYGARSCFETACGRGRRRPWPRRT